MVREVVERWPDGRYHQLEEDTGLVGVDGHPEAWFVSPSPDDANVTDSQAMIILLMTANFAPWYPYDAREVIAKGVCNVAPIIPLPAGMSPKLAYFPTRTRSSPVMTRATRNPPTNTANTHSHHVRPRVINPATAAYVPALIRSDDQSGGSAFEPVRQDILGRTQDKSHRRPGPHRQGYRVKITIGPHILRGDR